MNRRTMLKGAAALSLVPASHPARVLAATGSPFRRVRPGEHSWPSPAQWDQLGRAVGGRLMKPLPLLADCLRAPWDTACAQTVKNLHNPFFIGDQPSGTQVSGWLNAWSPAVSAYAVEAKNSADVAAAVNFAREHRLRLTVKGGGHSYQGTSNAADSLLVWTRAMNAVVLHDQFVPSGWAQPPLPAQPPTGSTASSRWP